MQHNRPLLIDHILMKKKPEVQEISECYVSRNIVLKLTKALPKNVGFKIIADNYFTSVTLVEKLLKDGFFELSSMHERLQT